MKFVSVADRTGIAETILFPPVYARFGHLTTENGPLEFSGKVEAFENRNGYVLNVHSVRRAGAGRALAHAAAGHSGRSEITAPR